MFTGLIEEVGVVSWIHTSTHGTQLQVIAPLIAQQAAKGESISVNGCCLTVAALRSDQLTFDLLEETLDRTNLRKLGRDNLVNLERALLANGRVGGHFVQGHVDSTARVLAFSRPGEDYRLEVELPAAFSHYVIYKGSIAVNGISLTVAELLTDSFVVWIIPHTKEHTNLHALETGTLVNLEFDVIAKYVERMLTRPTPRG
jgi:riboflavin synthase